jgi:hypothetical protein
MIEKGYEISIECQKYVLSVKNPLYRIAGMATRNCAGWTSKFTDNYVLKKLRHGGRNIHFHPQNYGCGITSSERIG